MTVERSSATGSIYDLGYRRYEGARLGRRFAVLALAFDSFRASYGVGRPGRAKIVPVGLLLLALVPAVIAVAVEALLGGVGGGRIRNPIRYDNYIGTIATMIVLFCAAQAPELVGRDQRFSVLSLYFTRSIERIDYAAAKLGALVGALLVIALLPQAAIFIGKVLGASDVLTAFEDNLSAVPAIVLSSLAVALVLGSVSLAIASYTPRRAYATAAIFAVLIITTAVAAVGAEANTGTLGQYLPLISPTDVLDGLTAWLFATTPGSRELTGTTLPGPLFAGVAILMIVVACAALIRRYQRLAA